MTEIHWKIGTSRIALASRASKGNSNAIQPKPAFQLNTLAMGLVIARMGPMSWIVGMAGSDRLRSHFNREISELHEFIAMKHI